MTPTQSGAELRQEVVTNGGAQGRLLVRMDEKLSGLVKTVDEVKDDQKTVKDDVQELKVKQGSCYAVQETRWETHKDDHANLSRRSNLIDGLIALGSAVGVGIGWSGKS